MATRRSFRQENPHDALRRLASTPDSSDPPDADDPENPAPTADAHNANLEGDVLIEGPGFAPDETDAELDNEVERELEAEALDDTTADAPEAEMPDLAVDEEDRPHPCPGRLPAASSCACPTS